MNYKKLLSLSLIFACLACVELPSASAQDLSPTRRLRRIYLSLIMTEPSVERYEALIASPDPDAFIEAEVDRLLESPELYEQLLDWGHEYIPIPEYPSGGVWKGSKSVHAELCAEDTFHAGAYGIFGHLGDDPSICNDPAAPSVELSPWWDPMFNVRLIGSAANLDSSFNDKDCGVATIGLNWVKPSTTGCGCGPNMTYCRRYFPGERFEGGYAGLTRLDSNNYFPNSQRRSLHDEPSRLLAHIVTEDRPFSDLILAQYSVVDRGLAHHYIRHGRQSGLHPERDQDTWFMDFASHSDWRQVPTQALHPHLLAQDRYTFDPTQDSGEPLGIPAAGVLTMIGPNASWPRPRVRAARWLEALACDEFSPPETPIPFPPYQRDPATEGVCLHCHTRLDPAAIHFKRIYDLGGSIAGLGNWQIQKLVSYNEHRMRFENTMLADTVLTPLSQAQIDANPNARFIDFLPPGQQLLGVEGDGTIGPRGFAKILLASGAFDQCAVRRAYKRFGGRTLNVGEDAALLKQQVEAFVDSNRSMKQLIRKIVLDERSRKGL